MGRRIEEHKFDKETGRAMLTQKNVITKTKYETVKCKFCKEWEKVVQYGHTKNHIQRYLCQKCGRTFLNNKAPERMQFSTEIIASALNLFYESASLAKIQRQIQLSYGVKPDRMTIYRWIVRYSNLAVKVTKDIPIKVGSKWVADETVLKTKRDRKENQWFWDIIDSDSRFLLASHLSESRTTKDAQTIMEKASQRANKAPKIVVTDKLNSYLDGIELTFGSATKHIPAKKLASEDGTQLIERFHSTLKDRSKTMRSFLVRGTARKILDGWVTHYNFFRPHSALDGKTPAEVAGAITPFKNWKDVVENNKSC